MSQPAPAIEPNATPTPPIVNPNPEPPVVTPPTDDGIPERMKKDLTRAKQERDELQRQLDEQKLASHKAKEDWKAVAAHHEEKAKDLETKYTGLKTSLLSEKKLTALTIEAQKRGINPAAIPDLDLLDMEEITVEATSTGKILVSGADKAVDSLMRIRPHWFSKSVPGINTATPEANRPSNGTVTVAELNAAGAQYNKSKSESDRKAYYDIIQKYKSQQQ